MLSYLSETAGLVIIPEVPVDGRINIVALQPMTVDDAIAVLNTSLKQNGLAALRMDGTLKIVTLDAAKTASIPVRSGADPQQVPQTEEAVTWIIPVRNCDAGSLATDLAGLLPAYALLTANASSNSLIMTATCNDIRRIVEIVHALDTQQAGMAKVRVFRLTHADASAAATLISTVFGPFGSARTSSSSSSSSSSGLTSLTDAVYVVAETDTNSLLIRCAPKNFELGAHHRRQAGPAVPQVLSRPYILASDNQEAKITVGDTVPFIQNTRTTDTFSLRARSGRLAKARTRLPRPHPPTIALPALQTNHLTVPSGHKR